MKHSFISMALCGILLVCIGCTRENEINSRNGIDHNRTSLIVQATASGFDNLSISDKASTRIPMDDDLVTLFNTGDAIGVFAIKNNTIADAVNNIKLTYLKTGLSTGDWNPPAGTELYWSEGVSYIAYYPYKEGITIDAGKTLNEIISSLTTNDKLKPVTDQSSPGKYTACDLMTAIGEVSAATDGSTKKTLNFKLTHQYTLLILKPQAYFEYVPPIDAVFIYRTDMLSSNLIVDVTAKEVKLNGVTPCKMEDGSYRAIVLPTKTSTKIAGSYKTTDVKSGADKMLTYSGSSTLFDEGKCYILEVKSPLPTSKKTRDLAPGDFVFFNADNKIEIFPGDGAFEGEMIPDYGKAVGMVVTCNSAKMTDPECIKQGWTHAYVMGLEDIGKKSWGDVTIDEPDIANITTGGTLIEDNMNGYSQTQTILAAHSSELKDKYAAFNLIKEHRDKNIIPNNGVCSPWFMPSIGQWFDLLVNICGRNPREFEYRSIYNLETHKYGTETKVKLNRQLAKVGRSLGKLDGYRHIFRASSEYNKGESWILIWHFEVMNGVFWDRVGIKTFDKSSSYNVRPFFAF